MKTKTCLLLSLLFAAASVSAENWPAWRGADGSGVSREKNLPLTWSATKNVRWKAPLPAPGNSTPIIWNERVFITQALDGGQRRAVIAFHRDTGKKLWQRELPCAVKETTHRQNPPCSASPITDGQAVYAHLGSSGVVAFDLAGKQLWHRDLGPVLHRWGNGGSPVLYKNLLIIFHGPGKPSKLMALDKRTGKTVWTSQETPINSPVFGSWSTPVILKSQRDELVFPLPGAKLKGTGWFKGYNPATGKALWQCDGLGTEIYAMPVVAPGGGLVIGISGHNGPTMAVRPGGNGNVTATHRLWRTQQKNPQRVGSGIIAADRLYLANANGTLDCLNARTGAPLWKERLGGNLWGSLVLAGARLIVSNYDGDTFIIPVGGEFTVLAKNTIPEPLYAAPAISQGALFLRTYKNLYCIAK